MKNRVTIFTTILSALASFALLPEAQAVMLPPDGGYPGFNTAEGRKPFSALPTGMQTLELAGIRSGATLTAATTPLSVRGRSFSTLGTKVSF
jgi:hypothetical protein